MNKEKFLIDLKRLSEMTQEERDDLPNSEGFCTKYRSEEPEPLSKYDCFIRHSWTRVRAALNDEPAEGMS